MAEVPVLSFQALLPDEAKTLVAVVRRIVPHKLPSLQDTVLQTGLAIDAQLVANVNLKAQVRAGLKDVDSRARASAQKAFEALEPAELDAVLRAIENTPFFQQLISATLADFYNRHVVWEALGYPGLDQRDGAGYIDKGFDKLDW